MQALPPHISTVLRSVISRLLQNDVSEDGEILLFSPFADLFQASIRPSTGDLLADPSIASWLQNSER